MKARLLGQLRECGYRGRIVSVQRLHDLEGGIKIPYRDGLLDQAFYQERLTGFDFSPPKNLPQVRSLIVVAIKQSQIRFTLTKNLGTCPFRRGCPFLRTTVW
jgi:hypothetical protein